MAKKRKVIELIVAVSVPEDYKPADVRKEVRETLSECMDEIRVKRVAAA